MNDFPKTYAGIEAMLSARMAAMAQRGGKREDPLLPALLPLLEQNQGIEFDLFFTGSGDNSQVEELRNAPNEDNTGELYFADGAGNRLEPPTRLEDITVDTLT